MGAAAIKLLRALGQPIPSEVEMVSAPPTTITVAMRNNVTPSISGIARGRDKHSWRAPRTTHIQEVQLPPRVHILERWAPLQMYCQPRRASV